MTGEDDSTSSQTSSTPLAHTAPSSPTTVPVLLSTMDENVQVPVPPIETRVAGLENSITQLNASLQTLLIRKNALAL